MIELRPLEEADLPLLRAWLERDHVARWWREPIEEEVAQGVGDRYLIMVDGRPAGMIQTYEQGPDVAGLDLFIGEEDLVGRGLGPQVLERFVREIVRLPIVESTVEESNSRSWRAFEKAGFRHVADVDEDGLPHRLMRLERG